jgi:thiol-disulfide isomerase/thioredoxin
VRKPLAFFLLLAFVPLTSCNSTNKSTVDRNGDLLDYAGDATYEGVGDFRSADDLIASFESGETGLFVFASATCPHCQAFEPDFVNYVKDTKADVTTFYLDDSSSGSYFAAVSALEAYFNTKSFESTPTMFFGKKDSFSTISWGENTEDYLKNAVGTLGNYTNIYRFGTAAAFEKEKKEEVLTFFYSSQNAEATSFYANTLYPLAKASGKSLFLIDNDRLSDDDRTKICQDFSLSEGTYDPIVSLGGTTISVTDANATSLVQSYYA